MNINAQVLDQPGNLLARVSTNGKSQELSVPQRSSGYGSSLNGGELLCLALATCFCNDIYRQARKHNIQVRQVEVFVESEFGAEGEPAKSISYKVKAQADASEEDLLELIQETDRMAEIHNTLRQGLKITLNQTDIAIL
jgi:uncharacterized OsmC-like protein